MTTKVFLIPHGDPGMSLTTADRHDLQNIGRSLRTSAIACAARMKCAAADTTLRSIMHGVNELTRDTIPSGIFAAGHGTPCCDDPDLAALLAKVPSGVRPSVEALMRADYRAAAMVGARTIWKVEAWAQAHRGTGTALVLHPVVLHLAMWSTSVGYALRHFPEGPHSFQYEFGPSSGRTIEFPGPVVRIPYPLG